LQKIREITNTKMPADIEIRDRFRYAKREGEIVGEVSVWKICPMEESLPIEPVDTEVLADQTPLASPSF